MLTFHLLVRLSWWDSRLDEVEDCGGGGGCIIISFYYYYYCENQCFCVLEGVPAAFPTTLGCTWLGGAPRTQTFLGLLAGFAIARLAPLTEQSRLVNRYF